MTTATRATWQATVGGHSLRDKNSAPTRLISARDMAYNSKLKLRQTLEITSDNEEQKRKKLKEAEQEYFSKRKTDLEEEYIEEILDKDDSSSSSSSEESEDDDDETSALLLELEKIKKERAIEKEKQLQEEEQEKQRQLEEEAMNANPLMQRVAVKRRWDDDVIFKNQAKGIPEKEKRFINDVVRSDFHRKFMQKYIQ